jgi:hypothetical protein
MVLSKKLLFRTITSTICIASSIWTCHTWRAPINEPYYQPTYPSEIISVAEYTDRKLFGGCVAATGIGKFVILKSASDIITPNTYWEVFGEDKIWWGDKISRKPSFPLFETGKLKCKIKVPNFTIEKTIHIEGYLLD